AAARHAVYGLRKVDRAVDLLAGPQDVAEIQEVIPDKEPRRASSLIADIDAGFRHHGECMAMIASIVALLHQCAKTWCTFWCSASGIVKDFRRVIGKARGDLKHVAQGYLRRAIDEPLAETILGAGAELAAIKVVVRVEAILRIEHQTVV